MSRNDRDGRDSRDADAPAPDIKSRMEAELATLGIGKDPKDMTDAERAAWDAERKQKVRDSFILPRGGPKIIAEPFGEAVQDVQNLEWVVDKLIPAGSIIAIAGPPKLGRKSLLAMQMCLDVARGNKFLGLPTRQGQTIFANFEDGRPRCLRRLRMFDIQPGSADNALLLTDPGSWAKLFVYILEFKPALVVLDPLIELELMLGCKDENRADELGKMLKQLRDVVRESGTAFAVPHHPAKATGTMRGSSALEGALDGWIYIHPEGSNLVLSWTNRDGDSYHVRYTVQFTGDTEEARRVRIAPMEEPQLGEHVPKKKGKSASGGDGEGSPTRVALTDEDVQASVRRALLRGPAEGLGITELRKEAQGATERINAAREVLTAAGEVELQKRRLVLTAKGRARAMAERPKGIDDILGIGGDDNFDTGEAEPEEGLGKPDVEPEE